MTPIVLTNCAIKPMSWPTKIKPAKPLSNPLNVDRYPDTAAALRDFQGLSGLFLDRQARAEVAEMIEKNGLSRRFVVELAAEVERERSAAAL